MAKKLAKKSAPKKSPAKRSGRRSVSIKQTGGRNVAAGGDMRIGGDLVFGSKTTTTTITMGPVDKAFSEIARQVEALPVPPDAKTEIKENVAKIKEEAKKGAQADPAKIERWLKFIATMSGDIAKVVAATVANPAMGFGTAIQLIAQKAQQSP